MSKKLWQSASTEAFSVEALCAWPSKKQYIYIHIYYVYTHIGIKIYIFKYPVYIAIYYVQKIVAKCLVIQTKKNIYFMYIRI